MPKIAALTMVYKSYRFLEKWIEHYGGFLGRENLYIISHGEDVRHRSIAEGCNFITVPRQFSENIEVERWTALGHFSSGLTQFYDFVVCGDCDELIVTDPKCGLTLPEYLAKNNAAKTVPLGFHLLPPTRSEGDVAAIDWTKPILAQTQDAIIDGGYSKPSILDSPRVFSIGGHEGIGEALVVDPNLVLVHLKYLDEERLKLAESISEEVRETATQLGDKGKQRKDWHMSYTWRMGRNAELELLGRLQAAPYVDKPDPMLFAYRLLTANALTDDRGTRSYRFPLRNPRKIVLPDRFKDVV